MIVVFIIKEPTFLSINNFTKILSQASTRGILALGVAGLIVLQGTDLSAGRILGLTAIISASLLQSSTYASRMYPDLPVLPIIVPFIIAIIIGGIFGAINGFPIYMLVLFTYSEEIVKAIFGLPRVLSKVWVVNLTKDIEISG